MTVRCSKLAFVPFRTCGRKLASRVDRPGCLLSLSGIAKTCIRNWCSRPYIPAFAALPQKTSWRFDAASWLLSPSGLAEENLRHELIDQAAFLSLSGIAKTCIWNWCSRPHIPAFAGLSQKRVPRFDITKLRLFSCPYLLSDVFFPQFFNGHIGQWKEPNAGNSRIPFKIEDKGGQIRRDGVVSRFKKMLAITTFRHYCAFRQWRWKRNKVDLKEDLVKPIGKTTALSNRQELDRIVCRAFYDTSIYVSVEKNVRKSLTRSLKAEKAVKPKNRKGWKGCKKFPKVKRSL